METSEPNRTRSADVAALTIDPLCLWRGEAMIDRPLAFVDLNASVDAAVDIVLPPYPVIGLGDRTHPLAGRLDATIEPPISASRLAEQVLAAPRAAGVTVQLLRLLPALSDEDGLTAESFAYALLQGSAEHRTWLTARPKLSASRQPGRIRFERDGDALVVTLDRAESGNAIDRAMRDRLFEALSLAALDGEVPVLLRATGRGFSLGAELAEFGTTTDPATAHDIRSRTLPSRAAAACAHRLEARVQGACVGAGLELAAWARRITATPDAWFQLPELAMGILPGAGGCVSLTRRIGRQRTALLILSGKRLSARRALDWGLVDALEDGPT